jgi:biotin synthase
MDANRMPVDVDRPPTRDEAVALLRLEGASVYDLLVCAGRVRDRASGNRVAMCAIINARSGGCSEDCAFCSQSRAATSDIACYPMLSPDRIEEEAFRARQGGASSFSIVTAGKAIAARADIEAVKEGIRRIRALGMVPCASLGILGKPLLRELAEAGLGRYHHNLETARSFFHEICTTHDYDADVATVRNAKELGIPACSGGILGMGESPEQRVELAQTLAELRVDSVALNFFHPVPGTRLHERLAGRSSLTPLDCLKAVAVFRLLLPEAQITICGGRAFNLRELQPLLMVAGANRIMSGAYLTTHGRNFETDRQMIRDLGFELVDDSALRRGSGGSG